MRRIRWIFNLVATAVVVCCGNISGVAQAAETNVFQWATRPQLSADQQKLLQLQKAADMGREDSPLRAERRTQLAALQKKLGPAEVRYARPDELIMSGLSTNVCAIHNPTDEGLVLTVSIAGDTEQLGIRKASIGRQAYFPPGSTIIVTNLYWTSPSTAKKSAK